MATGRTQNVRMHSHMPQQRIQRTISPYIIANPNAKSPVPMPASEGDMWHKQSNLDRSGSHTPGGVLDRQLSYLSASAGFNNTHDNMRHFTASDAPHGTYSDNDNVVSLSRTDNVQQGGAMNKYSYADANGTGESIPLNTIAYSGLAQQHFNQGGNFGNSAHHAQGYHDMASENYQRSDSNDYVQQQANLRRMYSTDPNLQRMYSTDPNLQRMYSTDPAQALANHPPGGGHFMGTGDAYAQQQHMDMSRGYSQRQPIPAYRTATGDIIGPETDHSYRNHQSYPDNLGRVQHHGARDVRLNNHPYAQGTSSQPQTHNTNSQSIPTRTYTDQSTYTQLPPREFGYNSYHGGNDTSHNGYHSGYDQAMDMNQGGVAIGGNTEFQASADHDNNFKSAYGQDAYNGVTVYNTEANSHVQAHNMTNGPEGYANAYQKNVQNGADGILENGHVNTAHTSQHKYAPYNDIRASSVGSKRTTDVSSSKSQRRMSKPTDCNRQTANAKSICTKPSTKVGVTKKKNSLSQLSVTGEANHVCGWPNCGVSFNSEEALASHVPIHTGDKPHECLWIGCSQKFLHRGHLNVHLRAHTGFKPYMCEWEGCEQKFSVMENMKRHMRTHTGEKPFTCDHEGCGKRFSYKGNRTKHQRVHKNAANKVTADNERAAIGRSQRG
ncbi:hypothetical protein SARC_06106 [Sphaeroforma arctica JP610]|uniref:C2H2-type domain-containing protein n=1 Tax=Sphaeroforma arctica JP610 TaxID=667725 RepID=A0A0L0FY78_9EUKA|nr:hypothetical protein, variant [Sphaeroforma arctica JP610]XP_014155472.1 hypothetical protein SARC_06106 [Sphaeroforma arctica JP610]KNC81569.1 hypothetical protein, variant [Sphaeroforma arctica JP610]KNC81570.1 hypothetical protein SARC_06106 [Sphaeroforma arctica JP610]|eukprot:XP_014155471.1 hypothetical protein, variant [Sphaeroforma arctica JP610]